MTAAQITKSLESQNFDVGATWVTLLSVHFPHILSSSGGIRKKKGGLAEQRRRAPSSSRLRDSSNLTTLSESDPSQRKEAEGSDRGCGELPNLPQEDHPVVGGSSDECISPPTSDDESPPPEEFSSTDDDNAKDKKGNKDESVKAGNDSGASSPSSSSSSGTVVTEACRPQMHVNVLDYMKRGSSFLKYTGNSFPHFRQLRLFRTPYPHQSLALKTQTPCCC